MTDKPTYLMSPPREDWALRGRANFKSRAADSADATLARREWAGLADAIVEAGGDVVVLPAGDASLTGLIYTAEAGEFFRDDRGEPSFLLPTMAVEHRRGEAEHIGDFITKRLGFGTVCVDATWEAQGDAIRLGADAIVHTYGVGPDRRTSRQAYDQVAPKLSSRHIQIGFVADPWFHGNTFLQFFHGADHTVMLVCPEALLEGEYDRLLSFVGDVDVVELTREQSRGYDTNALQVGDTVIAPATFSDTARSVCEQLGLDVVALNLDELFSKGGGAPVCLTNRLWGVRSAELPQDVLWSNHPRLEAHSG